MFFPGVVELQRNLLARARELRLPMNEGEAYRYLLDNSYNVEEALASFMDDNPPDFGNAINETVDGDADDDDDDASNEAIANADDDDDAPDGAIANAEEDEDAPDEALTNDDDDDDASNEAVADVDGEDQGKAKKSKTSRTPLKSPPPPPPESDRNDGSFSTPLRGGGDEGGRGEGGMKNLMNSMGSATLDDNTDGVTLRRGEEVGSKLGVEKGTSDCAKAKAEEVNGREEVDDKEEEMSNPREIPLEYWPYSFEVSAGSTPIIPEIGDMRVFTGNKQKDDALPFRDFCRGLKFEFDEVVPQEFQKGIESKLLQSENGITSEQSIITNLERRDGDTGGRLAAYRWCQERLRDFRNKIYVKSTNDQCYQVVPNDHYLLAYRLYNALCMVVFKAGEVEAIHQENIHVYLGDVMAGEAPPYSANRYGKTIQVSRNRSIAAEGNLQMTAFLRASYELREFGDRLIDDIWKLCDSSNATYIQFGNRKSIITALGGQYTEIVGLDESQYYGTVITDLEKLREKLGFDSLKVLLCQMRNWMHSALCNPPLEKHRTLKAGDVFIFHREGFHGGDKGKEEVFNSKMQIVKKYTKD